MNKLEAVEALKKALVELQALEADNNAPEAEYVRLRKTINHLCAILDSNTP
jgi:hypothetical protein